ncbi:riboflavin synthase alpha chain [Azorhizobium caulinodans ORS 571]|uniref:Riboflavin synthase n=1 Tax=Azorhizobium caulinodans (strain ATCC 43989 / DSM 5975 / JCM 20966 / LMG 6465 / NBRC 14845 / NCIMB 13405 / ORS 571) TaxID=438753 RepID=A8I0J2_AZOC5|nr:riboflavin synthase [Azorhizobium caulinodans]BAF87262.1 riboflavin synthase alpha chain [Azorhizobium caulinodans ORS 571]
MFTGIVTDLGEIVDLEVHNEVRTFGIATDYKPSSIDIGASIACSGVCLTVTKVKKRGPKRAVFYVDAAPETLAITTVAKWREGARINLERSLTIGGELGGHLVTGHVDGIARVVARDDFEETSRFTFEAPEPLARFIAAKGSVCLDGTSLTVNTVKGNRFSCLLIPHTLAVTTWGVVQAEDEINLEVDLMARYAARLAQYEPA